MSGRRHTLFSAGQGSFRAELVDQRRHPGVERKLLFTDTLYEDADAYRFLIEAAQVAIGRNLNWSVRAEDFPDYRVDEDVPLEEYCGNPEWRAFLADLRARTIAALPELVWIVEGRDIWEIFRDRRYLGNSERDPCSLVAKRQVLADWRSANCHRVGELFGLPDVFIVGIGDHEKHRFYGDARSIGIQRANAADGWIYEAPLLSEPQDGEYGLFYGPLESFGPAAPRLYDLGYMHNNCGGFCCKAGQAHWQNRFIVQPERFAYDAMMERKVAAYLGGDFSMLTDRRGGEKKPHRLDAFAERLRADPKLKIEYEGGDSGCGCMLDAA